MIHKYLHIIIISLSFAQIEYQIVLSDYNSIKFFSNEEEFLKIECDTKDIFPCAIFNATTFEVEYHGVDGMIGENNTLEEVDFFNIDSNNFSNIKLPNNDHDIYAFVKATAGATGHGMQTLYLINMDNAKVVTIVSYDMVGPQWYNDNPLFGYIEQKGIFMGCCPNFPIGWTYFRVINNIYILDFKEFIFIQDIERQRLLYKNELSKLEFTDDILELFRGRTLKELDEYFRPTRIYQYNYDENIEKEKRNELSTFIKYLYYSKKLNISEVEEKIFPTLESEFLECCLNYRGW